MKYRVRWRSKITGHEGHGEPMAQEDAEGHAKRANAELPDFEHWIEPAGDQPAGTSRQRA